MDADGAVTALGDGLMIIRRLFGSAFEGKALISKAISPYSNLDADQIASNIDLLIDSGALDVDFDGSSTALGDGLMVIRHLFGSTFSGDALVSKAISPDSPFQYVDDAFQYVSENIDLLL